jgi:general secretion pathway protein A
MATSSIGTPTDLTACESFYGLLARPFSLTPDLRFVFHSRSHTRALEQVTEALKRREGLVVITGDIGTGKTMLCRTLLETFEARTFLSVILDPGLTVSDLLKQVLTDFGIMDDVDRSGLEAGAEITRHQLVTTLQRFLSTLIPLDAHAVIMIDEAQHLDPAVLEEIRLLSNFETDKSKLLQIVLVGQPDLDALLKRPEMGQLNQRVARRVELHALSTTEVQDYIERRLFVAAEAASGKPGEPQADEPQIVASLERVRFSPAAVQMVATIAAGIPRIVNTLCDRVLELGYERKTRVLDDRLVLAAAERLKLPVPAMVKVRSGAALRIAAAVALFAVAGVGVWWWLGRPSTASAPAAIVKHVDTPAPPVAPRIPAPAPAPPVAPPPAAENPSTSAAKLPPPGATAPPKGTHYDISVAAFKTAQRASDVAAGITEKGLHVMMRTDSTGTWHQIVVGPYNSQEEAEAAQRILSREGFTGTRISVISPDQTAK